MIEGQEGVSWPQWQDLAAACERHGVGDLFRSDHYLPLGGEHDRGVLDAWGTICALAATTSTLRMGTLVSPATFRHPSVLAKLALTADHVSGGRVSVGLGAGWHAGEHAAYGFPFAETRERMDVFAEQLEIVRGLLGRGAFSHSGAHYELAGVECLPDAVAQPVPIIVGGSGGPRSVGLAARFADEYNTPFADLDQCRDRREAARRAWEDAGRDGDSVRFSLMTGLLVGRDEGEVEERRRALAERQGQPDWRPGGPWLAGTTEQVAEQLERLGQAGVDRVMCQLLLHDDLDQVELVGRDLARAA